MCQRVALCLAAVTLIETQTFAHRSTERSKKYFFPGHSFFFFQIGTQWPWIDSSRGYTRVEREKRHSSGLWQYTHMEIEEVRRHPTVFESRSSSIRRSAGNVFFFSDGNREVCARAHYSRLCIVSNCACREHTRGGSYRPRLMNNHIKFFI